jgi:hypothetical protein
MTEPQPGGVGADRQQDRLDALRRRRTGMGRAAELSASATNGPRLRTRRRHAAQRSRIGVAASSVAAMFSLVGAMALLRPTSPPPSTPAGSPIAPTRSKVPVAVDGTSATLPPVPLTARPRVQTATATAAAPVARTHGSH